MVATNDDILKALQDINDTMKKGFCIVSTQEEIKAELNYKIMELQ